MLLRLVETSEFFSLICFPFLIGCVSANQQWLEAKPIEIPQRKDLYEFWLNIQPGVSMGHLDHATGDGRAFSWEPKTRTLSSSKPSDSCANFKPVPDNPNFDALTGDGLQKWIITVNGSMPGPTLVAWKGSKVKVHVTNDLDTQPITLHFHGQSQKGSFWYDGPGNVNQCPIRPGETFTYEFVADPAGTHFYSGHFGAQRGDGLFGAFIVLSDEDNGIKVATSKGLLDLDREYAVFLHDHYSEPISSEISYSSWGLEGFRGTWGTRSNCYSATRTYDGSRIGQMKWHAGLINGRGWHDLAELAKNPSSYPLSRFVVKRRENVRLRIINSGVSQPFLFSVQGHRMNVIASDGNLIQNEMVDYLFVSPGERFDVILEQKLHDNQLHKEYFMIAQTLEMYHGDFRPLTESHYALAKLVYRYNDGYGPISMPDVKFPPPDCGPHYICKVFNCPFREFAMHTHLFKCINFDQVKHLRTQKSAALQHEFVDGKNLQEFFLNVHGNDNIDGLSFQYPKAPPASFPGRESLIFKSCDQCRPNRPCKCTGTLNFKKGSVIQMVFYNQRSTLKNSRHLEGFPQPIHIHGHQFHVLKMGWPSYVEHSGLLESFNLDIVCGSDENCNSASWANRNWDHGNVQDLNLLNPPLKDTLTVPVGGYAVIRLVADNPGWWLAHSQVLPHQLNGMAFLIKEGDTEDMPPQPRNFPGCYVY